MRGSDKELPVRSQNRRQNAGPCFRQLFAGQATGPAHSAGVQGSLFNGADNPREDEGLGNRDTLRENKCSKKQRPPWPSPCLIFPESFSSSAIRLGLI